MKHFFLFYFLFSSTYFFAQENTITLNSEDLNKVDTNSIEKVPIFPGCDRNMGNQALKECMNERMINHVKKHFNYNIGEELNLANGEYRISVFFKINKNGDISDILTKGDSPEANKEAERVVELLPKMEPGLIDGKPVRVPYYLPIKFGVDNSSNKSFPVYRSCDPTLSYKAQKECTTQKIMDYIKVSINYELADKLFPLDKTTQFLVSFTINKKGKLENITAKAHKREMAAEAINVLKRMPKLKSPGYKNGKPTSVDMEILMTIYF